MKRRDFVGSLFGAGLLALAGCGGGLPEADFEDAIRTTRGTLRDLLLGVEDTDVTRPVKPDPPLLKQGVYETVLIAADADAFARASQGSLNARDVQQMQRRVVEDLDKDLKRRGFSARNVPFGAGARGAEKALLATLTPITQEGGSPRERAEGKGRTYIVIRLTVTDPRTGAILSQRDYYSGHDVKPASRK